MHGRLSVSLMPQQMRQDADSRAGQLARNVWQPQTESLHSCKPALRLRIAGHANAPTVLMPCRPHTPHHTMLAMRPGPVPGHACRAG